MLLKKTGISQLWNNCLPSIEVENSETLHRKLCGLKIVFPVTLIGQNLVCEFEDSEGNHIELTAPAKKDES